MGIINLINDLLWTYILVALLLGCAVWFTLRTRFVQFRMIKEMVRLLGDSGGKGDAKEKHISSFQAFAISIASGILLKRTRWRPMLTMAFFFGLFQALMPLLGYILGIQFQSMI